MVQADRQPNLSLEGSTPLPQIPCSKAHTKKMLVIIIIFFFHCGEESDKAIQGKLKEKSSSFTSWRSGRMY